MARRERITIDGKKFIRMQEGEYFQDQEGRLWALQTSQSLTIRRPTAAGKGRGGASRITWSGIKRDFQLLAVLSFIAFLIYKNWTFILSLIFND